MIIDACVSFHGILAESFILSIYKLIKILHFNHWKAMKEVLSSHMT